MATRTEKSRKERRRSDAREVVKKFDEGFKPTAFTPPDGVSVFRFRKAKTYNIDIIPFIAGIGNPYADEGMEHFERTYFVHQNIGSGNDAYTCPNKTADRKCPICEFRAKLAMDPKAEKEMVDALKPKHRQLWCVIDNDEKEKGIQIMDAAYYKSFGELIKAKINAGDEKFPYYNFAHLDDGYRLKVLVEEDTFKGKTFFKPTNIEMRPRQNPLDEDLLKEAPCLDDCVTILKYDELKEIFLQTGDDGEDEDAGVTAEVEEEEVSGEEDGENSSSSSRKPSSKSPSSSKKPSKKDDEEESVEEEEAEPEEEEAAEEEQIEKGDRVSGFYKEKKFKGKVIKVEKRKGKVDLITVKTDGGNTRVMDANELTLIEKGEGAEEEEGEEPEEKAPPKKPSSSSKPTSKRTSKDSSDEDENDDLPFDDEEGED